MIACVILVEKQVANFVYLMSIYDAPSIMVNLLSNENKEIRYLAFHIIHMLFIHIRTLVKSITDSRFTAQPFNVTAGMCFSRSNEVVDYCKHMEAGLNKYPGDINVINHFYDFIIATKVCPLSYSPSLAWKHREGFVCNKETSSDQLCLLDHHPVGLRYCLEGR